jgi:hypothetical protein
MEKRSRRRTRDLVTQAASQGLSENDRMAIIIKATLDRKLPAKLRRQRALSIAAALVGAVAA